MEVFWQEILKIICKSRFLAFLIIVLLIRGLYIYEENANMYVDAGIERNKADYMQLMDELSGVLTPEKQQMLAEMEEKNNSISQEIADSGLRNFQGELADEDYWNICKKNVGFHSLRNKVDLIQAQADYVKEDMSKRYFMYENGWKQFFGNRNINYPLLFLLIISITAIFCRDYETDMYRINRTTANGDAVCYISKITAGIIVSVFTACSFWLGDILTAHIRFGLNNPNYPLQSISMFKDSRFDMTIGNTALLCLLFSIFGAAFFSVILMFAAILFRKNMYAIVVSLAVCVLPVYIINEYVLYNLPLPTPYLAERGFLFGCMNNVGEKEYFGPAALAGKIGIDIIVIMCCFFIGYLVYCKKSLKKYKNKRNMCLPLLLIIVLTTTSCGGNTQDKTHANYDMVSFGQMIQCDTGIVDAGVVPCQVIEDGCTRDLFTDPFFSEEDMQHVRLLNVNGNRLFYLRENENLEYELCSVDIESGEVHELYRHYLSGTKGQDYLDIASNWVKSMRDFRMERDVGEAWVDGDSYYYMDGTKIIQCSLSSKKEKVIVDNVAAYGMAYANGIILYINETDYNIWIYNTGTESGQKVSEESFKNAKSVGDGIYIQNAKGELFYLEADTAQLSKLPLRVEGRMDWMDEKYVYTLDGNRIFRYNYKSGGPAGTLGIDGVISCVSSECADGRIYINLMGDDGEELLISEDGSWTE